MKTSSNFALILSAILWCSFVSNTNAWQKKQNSKEISLNQQASIDSLQKEFINTLYYTFYDPQFWKKNTLPIFTNLKIQIDKNGKVADIGFSDSTDSLFVSAFKNKYSYRDKKTLERYAKAKHYSNVTILIPVSYEPLYSPNHNFSYENMESLMKFKGVEVVGNIELWRSIRIKVLSRGNS